MIIDEVYHNCCIRPPYQRKTKGFLYKQSSELRVASTWVWETTNTIGFVIYCIYLNPSPTTRSKFFSLVVFPHHSIHNQWQCQTIYFDPRQYTYHDAMHPWTWNSNDWTRWAQIIFCISKLYIWYNPSYKVMLLLGGTYFICLHSILIFLITFTSAGFLLLRDASLNSSLILSSLPFSRRWAHPRNAVLSDNRCFWFRAICLFVS
jgi:hypothetical protein